MFIIVANVEGPRYVVLGPYETYKEAEKFIGDAKHLFAVLCPEFLNLVTFKIHSLLR